MEGPAVQGVDRRLHATGHQVQEADGQRDHGAAVPAGHHRHADQSAGRYAPVHVLPDRRRRSRGRPGKTTELRRGQVGAPELRPVVGRRLRNRQWGADELRERHPAQLGDELRPLRQARRHHPLLQDEMLQRLPLAVCGQGRLRVLQEQDHVLHGARAQEREGQRDNHPLGVATCLRQPRREPAGRDRHAPRLGHQQSAAGRRPDFPERRPAHAAPTASLPHLQLHLSDRLQDSPVLLEHEAAEQALSVYLFHSRCVGTSGVSDLGAGSARRGRRVPGRFPQGRLEPHSGTPGCHAAGERVRQSLSEVCDRGRPVWTHRTRCSSSIGKFTRYVNANVQKHAGC